MVVNGKVWPYLAVEVQIYVLFILGMFLTNYNYSKKSFELFNNNNELMKTTQPLIILAEKISFSSSKRLRFPLSESEGDFVVCYYCELTCLFRFV